MKSLVLFLVLLLGGISSTAAGDAAIWHYNRHSAEPPFPLSERAQSIWASGTCWTECGSYTAWNLVDCLKHDTQGRCLKYADHADRNCQRECRTSGGPYLPIEFPWE